MFSYIRSLLSESYARRKLVWYCSPAQVALVVMLCTVLALLLWPDAAKSAGPLRVEVTAKKFAFQPAEITVKKGQPVDLVLTSRDVTHGLRIRELNLDVKIEKGATTQAQFTAGKAGDFVGHCSVFCGSGHGHMTLTIHVVE